jgi:general secretion pathway protein K
MASPAPTHRAPVDPAGPTASIIILVMVTLLFTAAALVAFLDKASNDLLVEARSAAAARLRPDAYSALEVTLAVLEDFQQADHGLHHPNEGWGDPLDWAGWAPADGRTVDVAFEDESGKLSLNHTSAATMLLLFQAWQLAPPDAQRLTDELQSWMHQNYTAVSAFNPDYEQSAIPYDAPHRAIRSYGELAAIDGARDLFYANGRPTDLYWRFCQDFSVFNFARPNLNGANTDVLAALGQFNDTQDGQIATRLGGSLANSKLVHPWFADNADLESVVSSEVGNPRAFTYTVSALRILITVHDKADQFRLSAVVSPQGGGATTVQATATDVKASEAASNNGETTNTVSVTPKAQTTTTANNAQAAAAAATKANLQFPFRILEIIENDAIPNPPPPPPPDPALLGAASAPANSFAPYSPPPTPP